MRTINCELFMNEIRDEYMGFAEEEAEFLASEKRAKALNYLLMFPEQERTMYVVLADEHVDYGVSRGIVGLYDSEAVAARVCAALESVYEHATELTFEIRPMPVNGLGELYDSDVECPISWGYVE